VVHFVTAYFTAAQGNNGSAPTPVASAAPPSSSEAPPQAGPPPAGAPFFQVAELAPLTLRCDYRPRSFDGGALAAGATAEALNLAPWGGVLLELPGLRLGGISGLASLGGAVGDAWAREVASTQAYRFAAGLRGIRPLLALLAAPVEGYRAEPSRRVMRGAARGAMAVRSIARGRCVFTRSLTHRHCPPMRVSLRARWARRRAW
jgi:autophagy-related protein 2